LMEPFYQIKGYQPPAEILRQAQDDVLRQAQDDVLRQAQDDELQAQADDLRLAQDDAAKATWAGVLGPATAQPINSRQEKMSQVREAQRRGFERIGQASAVGLILIPPLLWAVVLVALRRTGVVKRSLKRLAISLGILVVIGGCLGGWIVAMSRSFYSLDLEYALIPLAILLGLAVLGFVGYAWVKRDPAAKFLSLLTLAWGALLLLLIEASDRGPDPNERLMIAALLAYLLVPGAYLLFGQARWVQERRAAGALGTGIGALSALPALAIVPAALMSTTLMSAGGRGVTIGAMAPPNALVLDGMAVQETVVVEAAMEKEADEGAWLAEGEEAVGAEAPRLRQYFPETLYWAPKVVTDEDGFISLEIPMADSITTWRLTALASSQDGRLGFTTRGVRVFQDFFVDVDLPVALTQGDEISIPVGVFNYLPEAQEVRLVVEQEPWFELLGEGEQTLTIASNDVEVVYFPIRVLKFGRRGFQVTAWGEKMSDAIRREVTVVPDGKEIRLTESDWLRESRNVEIEIPPEAVPETPYVEVKIYPGVMAQAVEGLEKILRLPHG